MDLIRDQFALPTMPDFPDKTGEPAAGWYNTDPALPPTILNGHFINALMGEQYELIRAGGLTPDSESKTQIKSLFETGSFSPVPGSALAIEDVTSAAGFYQRCLNWVFTWIHFSWTNTENGVNNDDLAIKPPFAIDRNTYSSTASYVGTLSYGASNFGTQNAAGAMYEPYSTGHGDSATIKIRQVDITSSTDIVLGNDDPRTAVFTFSYPTTGNLLY